MASNNRTIKEAKVQEIKEKMQNAKSIVLTKYQGNKADEDTELRKTLREAGVEYKIYKNNLVLLAAKELGFEGLEEHLEGPVAVAFGYEDATAPARLLNEFGKNHKAIELKAGIVEGTVYGTETIKQIAQIPSREVLIAKFLGSIKSPVLNFAYLLSAISEKKEQEA